MTGWSLALTLILGAVFVWWLLGMIGLVLMGLSDWIDGSDDLSIHHETRFLAWCGPFMLFTALCANISCVICALLIFCRDRIKLPRLPDKIVILKRRTKRPTDSTP